MQKVWLKITYHADTFTEYTSNIPESLKTFAQLMQTRDGYFKEKDLNWEVVDNY